jgi:hypothetical protein
VPITAWLESTPVAAAIGDSQLTTGLLSSIHLLGVTLVGGGALVSSLRLLGLLFPQEPLSEITAGAARGIVVGLAISAVTGILLFAPRASAVLDNGYFQIKMLFLAAATIFHFSVYRTVTRRSPDARWLTRATGAVTAVLWLGVIASGSAFILLGE